MRSEDEVLALVQQKAEVLRARRRRARRAAGGSVAALVLVAGVLLAVSTGPSGRSDVTVSANDPSDDATGQAATSTTTPSTSSSLDPKGDEETTSDPSTSEPGPDVAIERPWVSPAPSTTTTTTHAGPSLCPASDIEMTVTTDRATYAPGEEVVIRTTATNRAGRDCADVNQWAGSIHDQDGRGVAGWAAIAGRTEGDWRWEAGDTRKRDEQWGQQSHTEEGSFQVAPGTYTATITWRAEDDNVQTTAYTGQATFTIEDR